MILCNVLFLIEYGLISRLHNSHVLAGSDPEGNFMETSCSLLNNMDISTSEASVRIVIEEYSLGMEKKSILSHFMCLKAISFISS